MAPETSRYTVLRPPRSSYYLKALFILSIGLLVTTLHASDLDTDGVTLLNQVDPSLQGTGIWVAQPEADETQGSNNFEVVPSVVGQPTNLFTWISSSGTASNYANLVGSASGHADGVAKNFYQPGAGVAPGVLHVDNYDANYFIGQYIYGNVGFPARVVNQSFNDFANDATMDQNYDNYAVNRNVLFLSGIATSGSTNICSPASAYNSIAVNALGTGEHGPTIDGRSKPDLISPGETATSFSTPYVSGAAAVLWQAGLRGDGGSYTNAASDIRTLKALLLNGAVKPADWTNGVMTPLDARYGAGVLNVFNSWTQLKGGKHPYIEATSVTSGSAHPPGANTNNELVLRGWDFNSLTNSDSSHNRINHYYFNLPGSNSFNLTSTLVWLRHTNTVGINNLNLFLYNTANSNLVLCSTSMVDNVEHLYIPTLPPGRYDLQVEKNGSGEVSTNETYALAFEFFNVALIVTHTNANAVLTWPLVPTGFQLESATNITPPIAWTAVTNAVSVNTNSSENVVTIPLSSGNQFFRLQRPQ